MIHERAWTEKSERSHISPEKIEQFRNLFAERMEDLVTAPSMQNAGFSLDLPEKIRRGEKIERSVNTRDALCATGQDLRLTPEQIDFLENMFLENFSEISFIVSLEKIDQIRTELANFLDELMSDPATVERLRFAISADAPNVIRRGGKINEHPIISNRLAAIMQDFGVRSDKVESVSKAFFK